MTTAGAFCNRRVVIAKRSEGLLAAAQRMLDEHVGCLVIVRDGDEKRIPTGLLTDRDIVVGVLARTDRHLDAVIVGDVMTPEPVTARETDTLELVFKRMRAFGVRRIPVVNQEGALQGLITFDDLIELLHEEITDLASLLTREREREIDARGAVPYRER